METFYTLSGEGLYVIDDTMSVEDRIGHFIENEWKTLIDDRWFKLILDGKGK